MKDDPGLVLLADRNEQPASRYPTRHSHTAGGGVLFNYSIDPTPARCEGTIITKLDGSRSWRYVNDMCMYKANKTIMSIKHWW